MSRKLARSITKMDVDIYRDLRSRRQNRRQLRKDTVPVVFVSRERILYFTG